MSDANAVVRTRPSTAWALRSTFLRGSTAKTARGRDAAASKSTESGPVKRRVAVERHGEHHRPRAAAAVLDGVGEVARPEVVLLEAAARLAATRAASASSVERLSTPRSSTSRSCPYVMKRRSPGLTRASDDSPAKPPSAKKAMVPAGSVCEVELTKRTALRAGAPGESTHAMAVASTRCCANGTSVESCAWRSTGPGERVDEERPGLDARGRRGARRGCRPRAASCCPRRRRGRRCRCFPDRTPRRVRLRPRPRPTGRALRRRTSRRPDRPRWRRRWSPSAAGPSRAGRRG